MIRGVYAAASKMLAQVKRQTIIAHNLSNTTTVGFKQELFADTTFEEMLLARLEAAGDATQIGSLAAGVELQARAIDLSPGLIQETGGQLDLALSGPGFFQVQSPQGIRYTRDGRFTRDAQNQLTTLDGWSVIGARGAIKLPPGEITVQEDGAIISAGQEVDRLVLAQFPEGTQWERLGGNYLAPMDGAVGVPAQGAKVQQGFLEQSNVDVTSTMVTMMEALRSYEAAQRVLMLQDRALGQAVNEVGKLT